MAHQLRQLFAFRATCQSSTEGDISLKYSILSFILETFPASAGLNSAPSSSLRVKLLSLKETTSNLIFLFYFIFIKKVLRILSSVYIKQKLNDCVSLVEEVEGHSSKS